MSEQIARWLSALVLLGLLAVPATASEEVRILPHFVVGGLSAPTSMDFAPGGRLLITEQGGKLYQFRNGQLSLLLTLAVSTEQEQGLLGVVSDPHFAINGYIYISYVTAGDGAHIQVSRFTLNDSDVIPGSEVVLLDVPGPESAHHQAGSLHFGPDGKLYVSVGDNNEGPNAQTLGNLRGKLLKLNPDGTAPTDNPFANMAGSGGLIWAYGLRNPFTFAVDPESGRILINDVGENSWEEIDDGVAGANYGWPTVEGPSANAAFKPPLYAYNHDVGQTIAGGVFYRSSTPLLPSEYIGRYFFADWAAGWIHTLDPLTGKVGDFASGLPNPVDLDVGPDGALYALYMNFAQDSGEVVRFAPGEEQQQVSAVALPGGAIAVSARNGAGDLFMRQGREKTFADWSLVAGGVVGRPSAILLDGHVAVFFRNRVDHLAYVEQVDGVWSKPVDLGGRLMADPVVAENANALLAVGIGPGGAVASISRRDGKWDAWTPFDGQIADDVILTVEGSEMLLLALNPGGELFANSWREDTGSWQGWQQLGGPFVGPPAAISDGDGTTVVVRAEGGILWSTSLRDDAWSPVAPMDINAANVRLMRLGDDTVAASTDADGSVALRHLAAGKAGSPVVLGGNFPTGLEAVRSDQHSYLFAVGPAHDLWYNWENAGAWMGWQSLGGAVGVSG